MAKNEIMRAPVQSPDTITKEIHSLEISIGAIARMTPEEWEESFDAFEAQLANIDSREELEIYKQELQNFLAKQQSEVHEPKMGSAKTAGYMIGGAASAATSVGLFAFSMPYGAGTVLAALASFALLTVREIRQTGKTLQFRVSETGEKRMEQLQGVLDELLKRITASEKTIIDS